MAFLTKESRETIFEKKINQLFPGLLDSIEEKEKEDEFVQEQYAKEIGMIRMVKLNYRDQINFELYEQFFRFFCKNKYIDSLYMLSCDY